MSVLSVLLAARKPVEPNFHWWYSNLQQQFQGPNFQAEHRLQTDSPTYFPIWLSSWSPQTAQFCLADWGHWGVRAWWYWHSGSDCSGGQSSRIADCITSSSSWRPEEWHVGHRSAVSNEAEGICPRAPSCRVQCLAQGPRSVPPDKLSYAKMTILIIP